MIHVALIDSEPNEQEQKLIEQFCQYIGIYKEQLERLTSDIIQKRDQTNNPSSCPACSATVPASSRFCPSCGAPLNSAENHFVQVDFEMPTVGYAIEFCESTAAGFPTAVDIAKSTGSMQTAIRNKKAWYLVTFSPDQFNEMVPIASSLSGMRNRHIYHNGKEMIWDEVFGFTWCAKQRSTAYRPIEYCFGKDENRLNPWGCKQSRMDWVDWAQWFSYGQWQKSGILKNTVVFIFDKQRIQHELATALYRFRFCPYMRPSMIEAVLKSLPEKVEVIPNGSWKYNRYYEEAPGTIKVIEKQGSGDFTYTSEYYSDGVRPVGLTVFNDVLKKAIRESQCTDLSVTNLLT